MTGKQHGIAVGYDGSEFSERALDWAIEEARLRHTKLTVCHFWSYPYMGYGPMVTGDLSQPAADMVQLAVVRAQTAAPGLDVQSVVESGSASRGLIDLGLDAELVVVGTHGLSGLRELMLGSVSSQVAAHSSGRVIVVRGEQDPPPENYPGRIVVGADGSPAADLALGMAFEEAELRGLPLTAICAWTKPDKDSARALYIDQDGLRTLAGERFHEAVDQLRDLHPGVKAEAELSELPVIEALSAAAASARLLVLGSRGVGTVRGRLLGSVSQTLLHQAICPVAVVHAPEA